MVQPLLGFELLLLLSYLYDSSPGEVANISFLFLTLVPKLTYEHHDRLLQARLLLQNGKSLRTLMPTKPEPHRHPPPRTFSSFYMKFILQLLYRSG